ncbi:MAG: hypothetical protein CMN28_13850 [Salinisphaeraceae bacterium]|nr:hypothetical protein [Salinisphaeraceae bacterium]
MAMREQLESMLASGRDTALLRFTLGDLLLTDGEAAQAAAHLAEAVRQDRDYSAAWKLYGKALAADGQDAQALAAFNTGIDVAERRGDKQAAKEMTVFRKRLQKKAGG